MLIARPIAPSWLAGLIAINGLHSHAWASVIARRASCDTAPYELQSSPITIEDTETQSFSLQANCGFSWDVTAADDVTAWFTDCTDAPIFTGNASVAQAVTVDGDVLTISIDPSKIASFSSGGSGTLTIQPPSSALTGGQSTYTPTEIYVGGYTVPKLNIVSTIFGTAYTHAKSTLKKAFGETVTYDASTDAKLFLDLPGIDDSKIDSSSATVSLVGGDGYYTSEYILNATTLKTPFVNGKTSYSLQQGDLTISMGGYPLKDPNSGREWSCLGGDGQGNYIFNFEVAGITYNGLPVAPETFHVHIYIHGYNYGFNTTSDATVKYGNGTVVEPDIAPLSSKVEDPPSPGATPIFTWVGEGDKPSLVDAIADDFYITWPETSDASELQACDIIITLISEKGDTLILKSGEDYVVDTSSNETQIAVTYLHWPFEPVFTTMEVSVDSTNLKGAEIPVAELASTYDIYSVYVYIAQQGGGGTTIDGTVTAYSFYGLANLTNINQVYKPSNYTLNVTINDVIEYYAEAADGTGTLVNSISAATVYDGSGPDDQNIQLIGNTAYTTSRINATATKTVNGSTYTFAKVYAGGGVLLPNVVSTYMSGAPGYIIPPALDGAELAGPDADQFNNTWIYHEKWAWQPEIQIGFHGIDILPYTGKFEWSLAKGSSQQFTTQAWPGFSEEAAENVVWSMIGNESNATTLSDTGLLTIASDESAGSVAVVVTSTVDLSFNGMGTVNVEITDE